MNDNNIGIIIRKRRTEKNMTLSDLSRETDLSIGYLSQLERGLTSIAPDTMQKICDSLQIDIRNFSSADKKNRKTIPVLRSYEREVSSIEGDTIIKHYLSSNSEDFDMIPKYITLLPKKEIENIECYPHKGEEFVFVLEGVLTLRVGGERYDMYPGDSAHYKSSIPHNWNNRTNRQVVFIAVNIPKSFSDIESTIK